MGKKSKIIVFDFETGGLNPEENPVMEIACFVTNQQDFSEGIIYDCLIKPYLGKKDKELVYAERALQVHGITIAETEEKGTPIEQVVKNLIELFKECNKGNRGAFNKPILAGHNVSFDIAFLKYIFELCGKDLSEYVMSNNGEIVRWDTMELAIQVWNSNPESEQAYNLEACCMKAGLGEFLAHRAVDDTRQTLYLLKYLLEEARGNKTTGNSNNASKDLTSDSIGSGVRQIKKPPVTRVKLKF